jgi:hypothetical protein
MMENIDRAVHWLLIAFWFCMLIWIVRFRFVASDDPRVSRRIRGTFILVLVGMISMALGDVIAFPTHGIQVAFDVFRFTLCIATFVVAQRVTKSLERAG